MWVVSHVKIPMATGGHMCFTCETHVIFSSSVKTHVYQNQRVQFSIPHVQICLPISHMDYSHTKMTTCAHLATCESHVQFLTKNAHDDPHVHLHPLFSTYENAHVGGFTCENANGHWCTCVSHVKQCDFYQVQKHTFIKIIVCNKCRIVCQFRTWIIHM